PVNKHTKPGIAPPGYSGIVCFHACSPPAVYSTINGFFIPAFGLIGHCFILISFILGKGEACIKYGGKQIDCYSKFSVHHWYLLKPGYGTPSDKRLKLSITFFCFERSPGLFISFHWYKQYPDNYY